MSGISFTGVFSVKLYLPAMASICQNISVFLYVPRGKIPPSRIDNSGSGIILLLSISLTFPSPLHFEHAPWGELKENVCGAGSLYEMPVAGHINCRLKNLGSLASDSSIISTPLP